MAYQRLTHVGRVSVTTFTEADRD